MSQLHLIPTIGWTQSSSLIPVTRRRVQNGAYPVVVESSMRLDCRNTEASRCGYNSESWVLLVRTTESESTRSMRCVYFARWTLCGFTDIDPTPTVCCKTCTWVPHANWICGFASIQKMPCILLLVCVATCVIASAPKDIQSILPTPLAKNTQDGHRDPRRSLNVTSLRSAIEVCRVFSATCSFKLFDRVAQTTLQTVSTCTFFQVQDNAG